MTDREGRSAPPAGDAGRRAQLVAMEKALAEDDLDQLVGLLEEAEARLATSLRHQRGHAAAVDAREMVRHAERFVALGVRRGQEAGRIENPREASVRVLMEGRGRVAPSSHKVKPKDVLPGVAKFYPFADAPAARFAAALAACRDRNRMGRADVLRELTRLAAEADAQRPEELRGRRRLDVNQALQAAIGASGMAESVEADLDWSQLDLAKAEEYDLGLREAVNSLNRLRGKLERRLATAERRRLRRGDRR